MTRDTDDREYNVGYGKPPKHSRFKKGQSGNPKGRPKGKKNAGTLLRERLYSKVAVTENGRRKNIAMIDLLFRKLIKSALEGDWRAQDRLIKLLPLAEADVGAADAAGNVSTTDESDEAILRHFFDAGGAALFDQAETVEEEVVDT